MSAAQSHRCVPDRDPKSAAAINGTMSWRTNVSTPNNHDVGCKRWVGSNDASGTERLSCEQSVTQCQRVFVPQSFELHLRIAAASCVKLQCRDAVAALQRTLRDIRMLDACARERDLSEPPDPIVDGEPHRIDAIGEAAIAG